MYCTTNFIVFHNTIHIYSIEGKKFNSHRKDCVYHCFYTRESALAFFNIYVHIYIHTHTILALTAEENSTLDNSFVKLMSFGILTWLR